MPNRSQELAARNDCILIVIDVQEKLMPVIHDREGVILNTARLVKFCGITEIPVIFTEQQKLGPTVPAVRESANDFEAIEKTHFNCFLNPEFSDKVKRMGRKTIILTGVESHICVAQTAISASSDWCVHVISDAVSSRSPDNKAVAIHRMRDAGASVSSTEMFIYEILVQAGTDEFKSVLPLVK
ncbi:MAG: isochorismatase hydrolase [Deltaproteobacteria bacterium]|nr:isochorismatase hydrolase [Deltaproteobacteria bacterium]